MAPTKILQYAESAMQDALKAVRNGMPVKTAADNFKVPRTTLLYKFKGTNPESRKMGPATIFSSEEEDLLVKWVLQMAKSGFPISKENFLSSVSKLAKELNKTFKNEIPGRKWYERFLQRHPEISLRSPQNLTMSRSSVEKVQIRRWFSEVSEFLEKAGLTYVLNDPRRVFNADESAFFLNPKGNKVLAPRGEKNVYATVNSNEKECLTVLINSNAAGTLAPPMIIFRYKRIPAELSSSVPKHWGIGMSENGWMTCDNFYSYMTNVFYPWAKENVTFPIIFFVDGHVSHLSYHLSEFCMNNNIILVALFPNATHLLQPMDVAVFRTLKSGWKEQVNLWRAENQHELLRRRDFAPLLNAALTDRVTPTVLENGFRKCGLYPWNPNVVDNMFPNSDTDPGMTPRKAKSTSQTETRNNENHLTFIESFIEKNTLEEFRRQSPEDWTGPLWDKSLFDVWKKINQSLNSNTCSNQIENLINEAEIIFEESNVNIKIIDIDNMTEKSSTENDNRSNTEADANLQPEITDENNSSNHDSIKCLQDQDTVENKQTNETCIDNKIKILDIQIISNRNISDKVEDTALQNLQTSVQKTPDKDLQVILNQNIPGDVQEKTLPNLQSETPEKNLTNDIVGTCSKNTDPNVPSPFKRALFWPEIKTVNDSKRKKEKIPSVVTSEMWQEYSRKKSERKAKLEEEKLTRKRKLESKKEEKNKLGKKQEITKKSVPLSETDDSVSDDGSVLSTASSPNGQTRPRLVKSIQKPKIGDYVLVLYDGKYFPGEVAAIKKKEYFVSAMAKSGRKDWRWPDVKDQIWYNEKDVVEIISPPKNVNSRGVFSVKEMEKYNE